MFASRAEQREQCLRDRCKERQSIASLWEFHAMRRARDSAKHLPEQPAQARLDCPHQTIQEPSRNAHIASNVEGHGCGDRDTGGVARVQLVTACQPSASDRSV
ncbi:MAG: hypothetical protein E6J90_45730 [Deltaproteobacteria bacterium]|nr:MAG: hypothetical protein E6J90_45730 [Deltaproteobacteria bacterium]TMQ11563.1 MAG: hypothetical protein E6J91_22495 [Deltaproteobacteria bacterium]